MIALTADRCREVIVILSWTYCCAPITPIETKTPVQMWMDKIPAAEEYFGP